jgi:hypothetical protein
MLIDNDTQRAFLIELYNTTQGDPAVKTTMQVVGAAIGIEKERAGKIAEELIGKGYIEIKTLSGGIGITVEGAQMARQEGAGPAAGATQSSLSAGPVLDENDHILMQTALKTIKNKIYDPQAGYAELEQMVLDIKAIEVHLISPKPKTAVVKELLRSLGQAFENSTADPPAELEFLLD